MTIEDDPAIWRALATEARVTAAHMMDPEARRMMLEVAGNYDQLAVLAEKRLVRSRSQL